MLNVHLENFTMIYRPSWIHIDSRVKDKHIIPGMKLRNLKIFLKSRDQKAIFEEGFWLDGM